MKTRTVAFLDILGFNGVVSSDLEAADSVLTDYSEILDVWKTDFDEHPTVASPTLFDAFIPASNSVFVVARNASVMIEALSKFLCSALLLRSRHSANPENEKVPTKSQR